MTNVLRFASEDCLPENQDILALQGVNSAPKQRIQNIIEDARQIFREKARPCGMFTGIPPEEFSGLYAGEGKNHSPSPLAMISRKADRLALFAVTLGNDICEKITALFAAHDFALGCMLDSVASCGTETTAALLERSFAQILYPHQWPPDVGILRYSPGYCGWHVSGQKKLFAYLRPEEIGIRLRESYLMEPLKSISGVIVAGQKGIHSFANTYDFCRECKTYGCRARIRSLTEAAMLPHKTF